MAGVPVVHGASRRCIGLVRLLAGRPPHQRWLQQPCVCGSALCAQRDLPLLQPVHPPHGALELHRRHGCASLAVLRSSVACCAHFDAKLALPCACCPA